MEAPVIAVGDAGDWSGVTAAVTSVPDLSTALREAAAGTAGHVVVVLDPAARPTRSLNAEVTAAVNAPALSGVRWLALVSDGLDIWGRRHDMGTYVDRAPTVGRRLPRAAAASIPAVAVLSRDGILALDVTASEDFTQLITRGWDRGWGSFVSSEIRFAYNGAHSERPAPVLPSTAEAVWVERLRQVRPEPTVTIGIRTRLERPAMLERAVASTRGAGVILAAAAPAAVLEEEANRLRRLIPGIDLTTRRVDPGSLPSRSAGIAAIVEGATGDYLWVLDDDDYLEPGALAHLAAAVQTNARPLVLGSSNRLHESWEEGRLQNVEMGERFEARLWHNAFSGWNSLPVCSVVYPRRALEEALAAAPLHHDLGEDYAMFLLALTRPGQDVMVIEEAIANVSIRADGDNVVTQADRGEWMTHTASFLSDITRHQAAGTPLPWLLGEVASGQTSAPIPPAPMVWWKRMFWTVVPDRLHPFVRRLRGRA